MTYKEYDKETLDKLHQVEMEILDDFVKVCEKHKLRYFLTGGTMLGAVRHKGFIPWDDDVDIGMPREDYDKFIEIGDEALGDKYQLECFEHNKNYHLPFAKVVKKNTIFDEGFDKLKYLKGIYIDIIPFENVDKIDRSLKFRAGMVKNIMETMAYKLKVRTLKSTNKPYFVFLLSLLPKRTLMRLERHYCRKCKNNNSKYINALGGTYHYLKETNLREDILPPKKIKFENREYNGMNKPDVYLSKLFGNYMELPPIEKRRNHKPDKLVFDVKKESEYDPKELRKLQLTLIEMLDEVVRICNKHKLEYFITGGTCLGAIRHKGFIPWDDDIDMVMPREDYEKFLVIARDELDPKYFLDYYKTNPENHFGFAKIKKNNTTFVMGYKYKCHNGFFLDIFPLDYNKKDTKLVAFDASLSRCLLETLKYKDKNLKLRDLRRPYISLWFVPFTNRRIHKMIDWLYSHNNKKEHVNGAVYPTIYYYKKDVYPVGMVFPHSELTFEGKKYHTYHDPDKYLTQLYGDYMKLPPVEKRVAHKPMSLDFNHGDNLNTKEEYFKYNKK